MADVNLRIREITSNGRADGTSDSELETADTTDEDRVRVRVGGSLHETTMSCLVNKPSTRLGAMALRYLHTKKREFAFDRHPGVFSSVIDYYRSGELHVPLDVCGAVVKRELDYWQISESLIEPCCWTCYSSYIDNQKTLAEFNQSFQQEQEELDRIRGLTGTERKKMMIWMTLDHPSSSKPALAYAVTSFVFVLVSIAGFVLETIPRLHDVTNSTTMCDGEGTPVMETHPVLETLDRVCTAFFTIELIVRIIFAPNKLLFFRSIMNIIDILALLPLYVQIILEQTNKYSCLKNHRAVFETIFILRIIRIFRVFHLVKHYNALKILVHAIKASTQELMMLSIFLVIAMLVFATLAYYAENRGMDTNAGVEVEFNTIPMGFWWAIITMTTVGYGDIYPESPLGQCIGVLCAVWGVLLIALTIPVISNNFSLFYLHGRTREQLTKNAARKRKESEQDAVRMRLDMIPGQIHNRPLGVDKALLLSIDSNSTDESGIVAPRESTGDAPQQKQSEVDEVEDSKEESEL